MGVKIQNTTSTFIIKSLQPNFCFTFLLVVPLKWPASNFENLSLMKVNCKFNVYIVLNGKFKNLNFLKNNLP